MTGEYVVMAFTGIVLAVGVIKLIGLYVIGKGKNKDEAVKDLNNQTTNVNWTEVNETDSIDLLEESGDSGDGD